jgi:hypothetical protein
LASLRLDQGRNVSLMRFDLSGVSGRVLHAKLYVRRGGSSSCAVGVRGPVASTWNESTVTWNTAPSIPSTTLVSLPDEDDFGGTTSTWAFDLTPMVITSVGGSLSLSLASLDDPGDVGIIRARESGAPARLVLLVDYSDVNSDGRFTIDDLYHQNQIPRDTNGDGVVAPSDLRDLEAWFRWYEIENMTNGRR